MSRLICQFKENSYSVKGLPYKIKRKIKKKQQFFDIFFKGEYVGFFDTYTTLTTHKNGREVYFLISENENVNDFYHMGQNKIGTIAFYLDEEKFTWKVKYIKLNKNPKSFYKTRKVLIEKCIL